MHSYSFYNHKSVILERFNISHSLNNREISHDFLLAMNSSRWTYRRYANQIRPEKQRMWNKLHKQMLFFIAYLADFSTLEQNSGYLFMWKYVLQWSNILQISTFLYQHSLDVWNIFRMGAARFADDWTPSCNFPAPTSTRTLMVALRYIYATFEVTCTFVVNCNSGGLLARTSLCSLF